MQNIQALEHFIEKHVLLKFDLLRGIVFVVKFDVTRARDMADLAAQQPWLVLVESEG